MILLTILVAELDLAISNFFDDQGVTNNPLEYPLTAVIVGLAGNVLLRVLGLYEWLRGAFLTEFFLKIGLVLLGARVSFGDLMAEGVGGLMQAVIMVCSVFFFTWWLAGKFNLSPSLKAIMASAVSVCGVSAAGADRFRRAGVRWIKALPLPLTPSPFTGREDTRKAGTEGV